MPIRIVRLGSERLAGEGLRVGTVRRPPRGVPSDEYGTRNFFDVWFPNLAPSEPLLKEFFPISDETVWRRFRRRFLSEMKRSDARRDLDLLAALSHHTDLSVGCYCASEAWCHRSILSDLLRERGARFGT